MSPAPPPTAQELALAPPSPEELAGASLPAHLRQWAPHIVKAAVATTPHGVGPDQWGAAISAVIERESGGENIEVHDDGHGHGLMGLDDRYHPIARTPDALDPAKNIAYGAKFLKDLFEKLPADMPFDEKLTRAADAFNGGPKHLDADEPDSGTAGNDYGTDVLHRSKSFDLSFLAKQAVSQPQADAANTLGLARATGMPAGFVAADPQAVQDRVKQASVQASLSKAPVLAAFAAQSPQHGPMIQEDADKLSWVERWFTGTAQYAKYDPSQAQGALPFDEPEHAPGVVQQAFTRVLINWRKEYEGLKEFALSRLSDPTRYGAAIGLPPDHPHVIARTEQAKTDLDAQKKVTQDWAKRASAPETPLEAASAKFPQAAIKAVGSVVPFIVAGEFAPAVLAAQTTGDLTADGVSPDHAAVGGVVSGMLGTVGAEKITKGLGSAVEAAGVSKLIAQAVPALWKAGQAHVEAVGHSLVNGWLMTAMTQMTERVTSIYDRAAREGRKADSSEYAKAAQEALSEATAALPVLGVLGGLHSVGRLVEAHGNALAHDAVTAPLRDVKVPPEELRDLLKAQATKAGYGARYIDAEHFEKVIRAEGLDPEAVAAKAAGDGGEGYRLARNTGDLFPVPIENYLVDLAPWHEQLREGVASAPGGSTLTRDNAKELQKQEEEAGPRQIVHHTSAAGDIKAISLGKVGSGMGLASNGFGIYATNSEAVRDLYHDSIVDQRGVAHDYKLDIPGNDKLLELQKPVKEQHPAIQRALKKAGLDKDPEATGREIYLDLEARWRAARLRAGPPEAGDSELLATGATRADQAASRYLSKLGIHGGRYQAELQAFDKGKAENYVLWSEDQIKMVQPPPKTEPPVYNTPFAQRLFTDLQVRSKSVDTLRAMKDTYKSSAQRAQREIDRLTTQVANKLSSAEQTAQQGIDAPTRQRAEDKSVKATEKTVLAGDKAAELEEFKKQRDLSNAMHKSKEAALKRADASLAKILATSDNATRVKLYNNKASGHPEYGWGYDLIHEALGLRQPDSSYRPADFNEVTKTLRDNGEIPSFDADALNDLIVKPRPPGALTVDELANVERALTNLSHFASDRSKVYVEGKQFDRQKWIKVDIAPTARALASVPRAPTRRLLDAASRKIGVDPDNLYASYSDFHTLLAPLGAWGTSQEARFQQVRLSERVLLDRYAKLFEAMPKELKQLGDQDIERPEWMPEAAQELYGPTLKRRDLWNAILRSGSEEGLSGLARGWKAEPTQVVDWLHSVVDTPAEWDFFKKWWTNAEELGDLEQALDSNRAGVPMIRKKVRTITTPLGETIQGGYAPERWHREGNALPALSEKDPTRGVGAMKDTERGFTIPVQEHSLIPDIAFDNLSTHVRALVKDAAMGDFVRDQARMLNDPAFKRAVAPLGDAYYKALINWHNTVVTGQMQQSYNVLSTHGLVSVARGVAARAVFSTNFKVAANLAGHLPFAKAVEGGDLNVSMGIAKGLFDPQARAYALANSSVLRARALGGTQALREAMAGVLGEVNPDSKLNVLDAASRQMWHFADMNLGQVLFHGLKHAAEARGLSAPEADQFADLHLDRLMPSKDVYGKPAIAANPIIGMWVLARNFENTVWNAKARIEIQQRLGIASGAKQGWTSYYAQMMGIAASLGLGYYVIGGHGRNEEEQKNGWLGWGQMAGRQVIEHSTYGSYLLHTAAQNFAGFLVGEGAPDVRRFNLFDTPEHAQAQSFVKDLGAVAKACVGRGAPSKALLAGLDAGARLLGVSQPLKSGVGAARVAKYRIFDQNDFRSTPRTYIGDAGKIWYGDVDRWDSNVFSDADKGLAEVFDSLWRK